jgi:hypothetical protein
MLILPHSLGRVMITQFSSMKEWIVNIVPLLICILLLSSPDAFAKQKFALIIGNGAYQVGPLKNPTHDAKLMSETLKSLGFEVIGGEAQLNLTREQLSTRILEFGDKLNATKGAGVFYYAGHGVQVKGKNYLIPIDAKLEREEHIGIYAVPIDQILQQMEGANNKLNLMILDACRNNPFPSSTRSLSRGVKIGSAPSGTLILYATRPGKVSLDGDSDNSPFTKALTQNMKRSGLKIEEVMRATIKQVEEETNLRQTPWQEGFVREEFYFVKPNISDGKCPAGTRLEDGECVIQRVACPAGTEEKGGECIAAVKCPKGTYFKENEGCIPQAISQLIQKQTSGSVSTAPHLTVERPVAERPALLSSIPTWSYAAIGVGLTAHAINLTSSKYLWVNGSFGVSLISYALATVGVSYGVYKAASWSPTHSATAYTLSPLITSDSAHVNLSFSF